MEVDDETARLIDFGEKLYHMSDGLFDITSGILRRAWKFDGSDNLPKPALIKEIIKQVGWDKVSWQNKCLSMRPGMEIDLGGIGKEYAVDLAIQQLQPLTDRSVLVNFGGDP